MALSILMYTASVDCYISTLIAICAGVTTNCTVLINDRNEPVTISRINQSTDTAYGNINSAIYTPLRSTFLFLENCFHTFLFFFSMEIASHNVDTH